MREIRFRGKSIKNDRWVYGYYVHLEDAFRERETHRIYTGIADSMPDCEGYDFSEDYEDVSPSTIGQYTGLKDANGKEIYDGDLVKSSFSDRVFGMVAWNANGYFYIMDSFFINEDYEEQDRRPLGEMLKLSIENKPCRFTVIGNIHDNPELIEK